MRTMPFSRIINKGIHYLSSVQISNGSFITNSSNNENDFSQASIEQTTFLNSFILLTTTHMPQTNELKVLRKRLATYLLSQKSESWSWNYWERNSVWVKKQPYPDDLDDTFSALAALSLYDKKIFTGDIFASLVALLTATEKKEGGPYRTWLVDKNAPLVWRDLDFAVNSNIAYFLFLHEITLPNLDHFFEKKLQEKNIDSPYYPSAIVPLYFLSRFYQGKQKEHIINLLNLAENKKGKNPLNTALSCLIRINLKKGLDVLDVKITYLVKSQKNGVWRACGFCLDPSNNGKHFYAGSSALTTAFCLEALQRYQIFLEEKNKKKVLDKKEIEKKYYQKIIKKRIKKYFKTQGKLVNLKAEIVLNKLFASDTSLQIPLISYDFFQALQIRTKKIDEDLLIKLGTANVFGWIAYTIFDDFFDGEGDPSLLSVAIISLRQLTNIFSTFPLEQKQIQNLFDLLLDKVDQANLREKEMGIKEINTLADKSIGHALGPLTILTVLGHDKEKQEFKIVYAFFKHYLIAKQLNDDAHDWEEDFKRGLSTPVVALLIKRAKEKNLESTLTIYKKLFWEEVIIEVCTRIKFHTRKAKRLLAQSKVIQDKTMLGSLAERYEVAAELAIEENKNVAKFLKVYSS